MPVVSPALAGVLGSIPSPGSNEIVLGPLHLRAYGLMIAIGVIVAVWIVQKRWEARGGSADDVTTIALWAVPAGLIGSRIYHVITDYSRLYCGPPDCDGSLFPDGLYLWQGGLGIPGGIAGGVVVGLLVARLKRWPLLELMDTFAPGIAVAQAIGRLGNWFNQEVYGRPTDLPWGLEIDLANRQDGYEAFTTFHPTFLYEGLWNLALAYVLVRLDATRRLEPGRIFALYVGGYFLGRLWVEALRIDTATELAGLRVNLVLSLVVIAAVAVFLAVRGLFRPEGELRPVHTAPPRPDSGSPDTTESPDDEPEPDEAESDEPEPDEPEADEPEPEPDEAGEAVDQPELDDADPDPDRR